MAVKSRASGGVIPITLGGEEFELVASARSMMAVSNALGGFGQAFEALRSLNVAVIAGIIRAGFPRPKDVPANLDELIFETGIGPILEPVSRFLLTLQNGGVAPDDEVDEPEVPLKKTAKVAPEG